ncbi:uncharacterized protein LOC141693646 [Apium graveolens]|uniref:uncharacterized protein LOC141693646 n=1 Tax=Apium graveolens TaxID=4045 RepID=UPI003D79DD65
MDQYLARTQELLKKFPSWRLTNVDREENWWADSLSKLASSDLPVNLDLIYVDILMALAIDELSVNQIQNSLDWRKPLLDYIIDNKLPEGKNEARSLIFKKKDYCVIGSPLYQRALSEPLIRCLTSEEAHQVMVEVHIGICGEHLRGKNLALKIIRQGVYWPII